MERNVWKGWRTTVCLMLVSCVVALAASASERKVFSVSDFGVKAGVEHVQTKEIQALIDHVSAEGGGIVRFAAGEYVTGIPGSQVENVVIEDVEIRYPGRATKGMAYVPLWRLDAVPEVVEEYPEFIFCPLCCRHTACLSGRSDRCGAAR